MTIKLSLQLALEYTNELIYNPNLSKKQKEERYKIISKNINDALEGLP